MTHPTTCQPWCNDHQSEGGAQWCRARHENPAYGYLPMELICDGGEPLIGLYGLRDFDLGLDDAERLGRAILDMVAAGRGRRQKAATTANDDELAAAMRLGMMATAQLAELTGRDVADVHEAGNLLTAAERAELVQALRWILLKRQAADIYPVEAL